MEGRVSAASLVLVQIFGPRATAGLRAWLHRNLRPWSLGFHDQSLTNLHLVAGQIVPLLEVLWRGVEPGRNTRDGVTALHDVVDRRVDQCSNSSADSALANRFDSECVESPIDVIDQAVERRGIAA